MCNVESNMAKQSAKEIALDMEYNKVLGQLMKVKDATRQAHQDLKNLSIKVRACSKKGEISEEYKKAAEETINIHLVKMEGALNKLNR